MQTSRIAQLRKLIENEPDEIFYPYALALELYKQNKEEAFGLLEFVISKNPDYLPAYYQLGKVAIELQRVVQAKEYIEKGIVVADKQNELKTKSELSNLLFSIED
ncbi:MAG: tetratricopeptide repeat protein [Cyclobacteriaceae bacterium]|jgi:tetratricopeptide (TPR) repeat protein|nr:tetratricopeptide repeat protein [Flammeovirgaceae bacterium]MCZ8020251.1 tetratricopeptide repeat protein [Cytophagales bacterium]MCZ8327097.1 tetratricopeptide repeat protein [Cyclobacteriaceae bacterium]